MLNHVELLDRLPQEPEIRYTQGGTPVASFDLAVQVPSKDRNTPHEYIPIVCWRERADCAGIERSTLGEGARTKYYYCHLYSSYERGTNENLNKMIRRRLPKGMNFDEIAEEVLEAITKWINNYPRKIHGFLCSEWVFQEQMTALFSDN